MRCSRPLNQDSEIFDVFGDFGHCQTTMGAVALELGTGGNGSMSHFGPVDFGLGVVREIIKPVAPTGLGAAEAP